MAINIATQKTITPTICFITPLTLPNPHKTYGVATRTFAGSHRSTPDKTAMQYAQASLMQKISETPTNYQVG